MFSDPQWPNKYVGVSFVDKGRDFSGWDCWGLAYVAYREEQGIMLPRFEGKYESALTSHAQIQACFTEESKHWIGVADPQPGDIAWCRVAGEETHVGLHVRPGLMLHAIRGHDTSIVRVGGPLCPVKIERYYRHSLLAG